MHHTAAGTGRPLPCEPLVRPSGGPLPSQGTRGKYVPAHNDDHLLSSKHVTGMAKCQMTARRSTGFARLQSSMGCFELCMQRNKISLSIGLWLLMSWAWICVKLITRILTSSSRRRHHQVAGEQFVAWTTAAFNQEGHP